MIRHIVHKELLLHLQSLRFIVGFAIIAALFAVGAITWNVRYEHAVEQYRFGLADAREESQQASDRLYRYGFSAWKPPNPLGFVSGGNSRGLPNLAIVSGGYTFRLEQKADRNPLLFRLDLDWVFIIGTVASLLALLLTYDGISGERQTGLLRQILANSVPRDALLMGKYAAALLVICLPLLVGALLAALIVGQAQPIGAEHWSVLAGIFTAGILSVSAFVWLGLLVSSRSSSPALSLLIALVLWSILAVFVPHSGVLIGDRLAPALRASAVEKALSADYEQAMDEWGKIHERNPDSAPQRPSYESYRNKHYVHYWNQLVRQIEVAYQVTQVSPVVAIKYAGEVLASTGIVRHRAFLDQLVDYRRLLVDLNSRRGARPVGPEEVRFAFREIRLADRLASATGVIALLIAHNALFFGLAYWSFRRSEVY